MMSSGVWISASIPRMNTPPDTISVRHSAPLAMNVVETAVRTPEKSLAP